MGTVDLAHRASINAFTSTKGFVKSRTQITKEILKGVGYWVYASVVCIAAGFFGMWVINLAFDRPSSGIQMTGFAIAFIYQLAFMGMVYIIRIQWRKIRRQSDKLDQKEQFIETLAAKSTSTPMPTPKGRKQKVDFAYSQYGDDESRPLTEDEWNEKYGEKTY